MEVLGSVFALIVFFSLILLIVGLISPKLSIWWGDREKKSRKKVLLYYGSAMVVSFILFAVFVPTEEVDTASVQSESSDNEQEEEKEENGEQADQQDAKDTKEEEEKEKQTASETVDKDNEATEKEKKKEKGSKKNKSKKVTRNDAVTIMEKEYPTTTITSYEEDDVVVGDVRYFYMEGVTGTSPAISLYVSEKDGKIYNYLDKEMVLLDSGSDNKPVETGSDLYIQVTDAFYEMYDDKIVVSGETNLVDGIEVVVEVSGNATEFSPVSAVVDGGMFVAEVGLDTYILNDTYTVSTFVASEDNPKLVEYYGEYNDFVDNYRLTGANVEKAGWFSSDYILENTSSYQVTISDAWTKESIAQFENQLKMENAWVADYDVLEKSPERYKGEYVTFTGEIYNIHESDGESYMLIAVTMDEWGYYNYDDTIVVDYNGYSDYMTGDVVTVFGEVRGTEEIINSFGVTYLVPLIDLDLIY